MDSILSQNFDEFEIILVDAGSTDDTSQILEDYKSDLRLKVFIEPGINGQDGFISAFHKTSGEYVMCMPISDSYISNCWFKKCADILDQNHEISLVHGISIHNNDYDDCYYDSDFSLINSTIKSKSSSSKFESILE